MKELDDLRVHKIRHDILNRPNFSINVCFYSLHLFLSDKQATSNDLHI